MSPSIFDRIFRDENGNIVIGQMPNLPVIVGITASVLRLLFSSGEVALVLDLVAFGSLFTWAWQELFDGVNYFRRGLGLLALLGLIISKVLLTQI